MKNLIFLVIYEGLTEKYSKIRAEKLLFEFQND